MARNGSGTFTREGGATAWVDDRNAGTKIRADLHDTHDQDIADAITASLAKDGQTTTTARIPFAFGVGLADGTAGSPAINWTSDTNTGIYRAGADQIGLSVAGAQTLLVANGALTLTKTSDDATGTSLNTFHDSATPAASDQIFSALWQSDDSAGNVTIYAQMEALIADPTNGSEDGLWRVRTMRAGTLTVGLILDTALRTETDGATNFGTSSIGWGDVFLAATKKIDFGAGDVTLTHSTNALTVAGGTFAASGTMTVTGDFAVNTNAFAVTASNGNCACTGDFNVGGNLSSDTLTLTTATGLLHTYVDASAVGPIWEMYHDSSSPAAADAIFQNKFFGRDSGNTKTEYARIEVVLEDPTDGSEDGAIRWRTMVAGTLTTQGLLGNGIAIGSPTGSYQGLGTLNAKDVYNDGVALTCFGVEQLVDGKVNKDKWHDYYRKGAGKKAENPVLNEFCDMLGECDPRDPAQYIAKLKADRALPGMPNERNWQHNKLSQGNLMMRQWLATELLASAFAGFVEKVEARLDALEAS